MLYKKITSVKPLQIWVVSSFESCLWARKPLLSRRVMKDTRANMYGVAFLYVFPMLLMLYQLPKISDRSTYIFSLVLLIVLLWAPVFALVVKLVRRISTLRSNPRNSN